MKSITSLIAGTLLLGASTVAAYGANNPGALVYKGCFSTSTGLSLNQSYTYNTDGWCQTQCAPQNYAVIGLSQSTDCYCGNEIPPTADLVSDSFCDAPCAGFGTDMCGGAQGYWSVYLSGVTASASTAAADTSTSSTASSGSSQTASSKPSVVTSVGPTVVVTAPADSSATSTATKSAESKSSGPNKAGIAAGAVIGVVAVAGMVGGIFLFMRNRKRRAVEEEYRRNAAVSGFIHGGKPPNSSGGDSTFTDTRLDAAVMAQRRMSDGSIADNQDYSRRILKVTNA